MCVCIYFVYVDFFPFYIFVQDNFHKTKDFVFFFGRVFFIMCKKEEEKINKFRNDNTENAINLTAHRVYRTMYLLINAHKCVCVVRLWNMFGVVFFSVLFLALKSVLLFIFSLLMCEQYVRLNFVGGDFSYNVEIREGVVNPKTQNFSK